MRARSPGHTEMFSRTVQHIYSYADAGMRYDTKPDRHTSDDHRFAVDLRW